MVQALRWACGSTKFYLHRQLALVNKVVRCTELIETKALSAHTDAADCLKPIDEKAILIMSNKDFPSCSLCSCEVPFGPIYGWSVLLPASAYASPERLAAGQSLHERRLCLETELTLQ